VKYWIDPTNKINEKRIWTIISHGLSRISMTYNNHSSLANPNFSWGDGKFISLPKKFDQVVGLGLSEEWGRDTFWW